MRVIFGHGAGGPGKEHFRTVADDAAAFLGEAGHEAGDVHQREDGDRVDVADADEAGGLVGGIDVDAAGLDRRLVGDDADDEAFEFGEADEHVGREVRHDFKPAARVHEAVDDLLHVERRSWDRPG